MAAFVFALITCNFGAAFVYRYWVNHFYDLDQVVVRFLKVLGNKEQWSLFANKLDFAQLRRSSSSNS